MRSIMKLQSVTVYCYSKVNSIYCSGNTVIVQILRRYSRPVDAGREVKSENMSKIRNIGIIAHVDAGKTTTTERMLYYSGISQHLGNVDSGDTVMDYMKQERDRGITITSAAITFPWEKHRINLIDTPGHIDFTVEVERSLRVLDGAVVILDASAGVEAQTLSVWRQALNYKLPVIVFLNKMDKRKANIQHCLRSIQDKLKSKPLLLHLQLGYERDFKGVVDLATLQCLEWDHHASSTGDAFTSYPLTSSDKHYETAVDQRRKLIEQLADIDDGIADLVLSDVDMLDISGDIVNEAMRRVTLSRKVVPVLCGSALRNTAIQPLLSSIVKYMPSPLDRNLGFAKYYGNDFCALAFKVMFDKQRGMLTFLRIYSGSIRNGESVYNINRELSEKTNRLFQVHANDFNVTSSASAGNIVLVAGLKETCTGDTITSSHKTAKAAASTYLKHEVDGPPVLDEAKLISDPRLMLTGVDIPEPVFFCSIEPPSVGASTKRLTFALECLTKEDPSLRVETDEDSGRTILSGMGELHLNVILSRILHEHNVDADIGPIQIAYRESVTKEAVVEEVLDKTIGEQRHKVSLSISVAPNTNIEEFKRVRIKASGSSAPLDLKRPILKAIENGIHGSLRHGPLLSAPVHHVDVCIHAVSIARGTSLAMVSACAAQAVRRAILRADCMLMEPMMKLEVTIDEDGLHSVLADLSRRRSRIQDISVRYDLHIVHAIIPLAELIGYSTDVRTITSGRATVGMELSHYENMPLSEQNKCIEKVLGYVPTSQSN